MNQNIKEHPTSFMKWRQKLGKTICIKNMLKFTFHHLKENKLKIFRWKLLHFILPCKQLLYQWKIESTPLWWYLSYYRWLWSFFFQEIVDHICLKLNTCTFEWLHQVQLKFNNNVSFIWVVLHIGVVLLCLRRLNIGFPTIVFTLYRRCNMGMPIGTKNKTWHPRPSRCARMQLNLYMFRVDVISWRSV